MSRLLLGVSGGIAAYKAVETARLATRAGHAVRVIQTSASRHFVGSATFTAITGAPVLLSEFEPDPVRGAYPGEPVPERTPISHLALVDRAQAFLIAPASANTIAKLAAGLADNLLTTAALAASCPVLLAPAMNHRMYLNPATQANLGRLADRGMVVIAPGEGELASYGERGVGRMAEPAEILARCEQALASEAQPGPWAGRRVLVTAGGTREPIDSVRFIGNRSSGRMGLALAAEAARLGAEVTVIAANVSLPRVPATRTIEVTTAAELLEATRREFEGAHALLMAAAVADFRPVRVAPTKLKKEQGVPSLELEPTDDVLRTVSALRRPEQLLVGFAAEHGERAREQGLRKLHAKGLDAIVINDISRPSIGFDARENEVTIITADGEERHIERAGKDRVAASVLEVLGDLRTRKETSDRTHRADAPSAAGV